MDGDGSISWIKGGTQAATVATVVATAGTGARIDRQSHRKLSKHATARETRFEARRSMGKQSRWIVLATKKASAWDACPNSIDAVDAGCS
jgi:hypothetical protein